MRNEGPARHRGVAVALGTDFEGDGSYGGTYAELYWTVYADRRVSYRGFRLCAT